jgi:toxin-antitoxin system PIN domain toxin
VTVHLLDVNVLIALIWPAHEKHAIAQRWLANDSKGGWATCPLTQAAFVRILSNPAFSRDAVKPFHALKILHSALQHPLHRFWPDDIGALEALEPVEKRLFGHQQITDAYLLGLTIHRKGKLLTLDRAVSALLPLGAHNAITLLR